MLKFFRNIAVFLSLLFLFIPAVACWGADVSAVPEFSPLCWHEEECKEMRRNFIGVGASDADLKAGWIKNISPCVGEEWGRCLPAGATKTSIAFGGKDKFTDIGDYIVTIYNYALRIASILAVVMIIIAGVQYVTSGGNSEMISSAKKRITGSLIGLFIAYMSFFILNSINPALVNLRLPQVWMVKPMALMTEFCSAAPAKKVFALASEKGQKIASDATTKAEFGWTREANPAEFKCGRNFFMQDGGQTTCKGDVCESGKICVDYESQNPDDPFACVDGMLAGKIGGNAGGMSGVVVDNNVQLIAVCDNGDIQLVDEIDVNSAVTKNKEAYQSYRFANESVVDICGADHKLMGFYLGVEVNDEAGVLGAYMEGVPFVSNGIDDWYAVGQLSPGSHNCSVNLSDLGLTVVGVDHICSEMSNACSCAGISKDELIIKLVEQQGFIDRLISLDELQKGYSCKITINRGQFPAVNNSGETAPTFAMMLGTSVSAVTGLVVGGAPGAGVGVLGSILSFFGANADDPTNCWNYQRNFTEAEKIISKRVDDK